MPFYQIYYSTNYYILCFEFIYELYLLKFKYIEIQNKVYISNDVSLRKIH